AGGFIELSATAGTLTLPAGTYSVNAAGPTSASFSGGQIVLLSSALAITGAGSLAIQANAAGIGTGGTVIVEATGQNSNLTIGSATGRITISTTGGSSLSQLGDGGSIKVVTGNNLTVLDSSLLVAGPLGINGKGATIELDAGISSAAPSLLSISTG